jgi:hypothetical protein
MTYNKAQLSFPLQRDCDAFYGNPRGVGGATVSKKWYAENIIFVKPPWEMRMGEIKITRIPFHKKAASALQGALAAIAILEAARSGIIHASGLDVFSGSFNYRPMRGGSALSMHSYGIAIDFDAARNGLGNRKPHLALYPEIIDIFLEHGAIWGGDWNGNRDTLDERRCDGMHFQFARL